VRPLTLQDIADRCQVSRMTVSCALRGDRKSVSQTVMDRIVRTAAEMGYNPALAHAARRLKYQHSPRQVQNLLAAVFFPYHTDRYWTTIFQGLGQALEKEHYGVLLKMADAGSESFHSPLPYVFHRGEVDGAVFFTDEYRMVEDLRAEPGFGNRPIVTVTGQFAGCSAVLVDDHQVGRLAAAHLLELGHRRILCFHHPDMRSTITKQRVAGHCQAFVDRQLDPDTGLRHAPWVWDDRRGLDVAMTDVLCQHPDVTAILCPNDGFGIPVARTLRRLGYQIPRDMSLIGADDSDELLDSRDRNIWSTVRLPLHELGAESARLLIRRIQGTVPDETVVVLPVELVARGTTCPPSFRANAARKGRHDVPGAEILTVSTRTA